jgi:hypothetical protein
MSSDKTQIVMHVMPHEMTQFNRCVKALLLSLDQFDIGNNALELYATLNLSPKLINLDANSITADVIINDFNNCIDPLRSTGKISIKSEIINDNSILGTTDQKRKAVRQSDTSIKNFIFLDSDIYFHWSTLKYLIDATQYIDNEFYVITPQTVKLWDESWDVITNERFAEFPYGFHKTIQPQEVENRDFNDISIQMAEVPTFKFGCGWFTLYSANLWKFTDIPDALGPYGSEDTFLMFASMLMKQHGYDIQQYMLEGLYIIEDHMYKPQSYEGKVSINTAKEQNYVKHNTPKFAELMQQFANKLAKRNK